MHSGFSEIQLNLEQFPTCCRVLYMSIIVSRPKPRLMKHITQNIEAHDYMPVKHF